MNLILIMKEGKTHITSLLLRTNHLKGCLIVFLLFHFNVYLTAQSTNQIPSKIFEITDILVDACGTPEGANEMVYFQVGHNPVNVNNLRVDGAANDGIITQGAWPNTANLWLGIATPPAKPTEVANINNSITCGGKLIEPIGGILPAGAKVLLITSTDFDPLAHSFASLTDTLYVIFQNSGNTAGHFRNYDISSSYRTLILYHTLTSTSDTVTYNINSLIDQVGNSVAADGAGVRFTWSGVPTYYNKGCQVPQIITYKYDAICQGGNYTLPNGIVVSSAGTFPVTLNNIHGCDSLVTTILTVSPNPIVTVSASPNPICAGNSTTLTAGGALINCIGIQALDGSDRYFRYATVYDWDCCLFSAGINESPFSWLVDGHYKIQFDCSGNGTIVESTGGCAYYYPVGSAYIPTFGYSSNPTYESLLTDPGCCNPDGTKIFVELTEEITPDSSIFNFNWAGPNSFTSSMQNPMIINAAITASGIYTVTVTNSNGCSATGDIAVTVNPLPVANAGNDQSVYQGSSVTLTATGGTSYNWNNGVINGVPFYPTITTTYTVSVTDANGCSATDNVVIYVSTLSLLPPPDLRCASVDASGNVTLSWKAVPDPLNNFNSYHIYSSLSFSGPFTIVDSIFNINQTTYTDIGAGANTQSVYYYIKTRSDSVGGSYSEPSDTIRTIFLNTVNSGTGTAELTWNPIHNPELQTSFEWYHIYREYPPGNWVMIDSTKYLTYSDTITVCNAFINYYIDIDDSLPCTSTSSIDGDIFQDANAPVKPVIDSVSIDSLSGNSVIGWTASPSGDTHGYVIYENINGVWVAIDTVWGRNATNYINTHTSWANPDSSSLSYCVAAFDSCMNTSPLSINHNTIFLTSTFDICGEAASLNWTPYINMHPELMGYRIYVKENNGPLTLLATNPSTDLSFTHSPLTQNSVYIYSVQAFNSTDSVTSTSNSDTVHAYNPMQPQFVYLRYVTVRDNNHVELKAVFDTSSYVSKCKIMRADSISGIYILIGTVIPSSSSNTITFNDATAEVNKKSYYYKVIIVDSCGNDVITSNIGRTIFLQAEPVSDMKNYLTWNEYEDWLGSVSAYYIYRKVDDVFDTNPIVTLPSGSTTYTDDVSALINTGGKFGYAVEAHEGFGNPYLYTDTSYSNVAPAMQPPRLYVPNAFVPNSLNNIFIPINIFVDTEDYLLSIYNRWGLQIFQTTDIKTGWNGTYHGKPQPQGVYVYLIRYKNSEGRYIEKLGSVTLLR